MASVIFGEMKHCDWLLTGPDFPVFPTGNTQFLLPVILKRPQNEINLTMK